MNDAQLLATLLFSETKDLTDAEGIANVVKNRMNRPQRFGSTLPEVIFAPGQFSGVNSNEWNKVTRGQLNPDEENIFKQMLRISHASLTGKLQDTTDGADHYVNLKLARPAWARVYEKKKKIGEHTYFKETLQKRKEVR